MGNFSSQSETAIRYLADMKQTICQPIATIITQKGDTMVNGER